MGLDSVGNQDAQGRALSWGAQAEDPGDEHRAGRRPEKERATAIYQMSSTHLGMGLGMCEQHLTRSWPKRKRRLRSHGEVESQVGARSPSCGCSQDRNRTRGKETLALLAPLGAWPRSRQGPKVMVGSLLRVEERELSWTGAPRPQGPKQRPSGRAWLLFQPRLAGRPLAPLGRRCTPVSEGLGSTMTQRQIYKGTSPHRADRAKGH